jgi:Protein of unknown function (DUF3025)
MDHWRSNIKLSHPCWEDYRDGLLGLDGESFPDARKLNTLLPAGLSSGGERPIHFVPANQLPGVEYEEHIFRTGEVSTREKSWHDLFNALVWSRFPSLKVAMNAVHFRELGSGREGRRGKQRDALTLLDESGVIVVSSTMEYLDALAGRDWMSVFRDNASAWHGEIKVFVIGHALLEKFPQPYKSLTAHALLMRLDNSLLAKPRVMLLQMLDEMLAERLLAGSILDSPASLSPLPLMGIPGWWPSLEQNADFYEDQQVFRPLREKSRKAPVYKQQNLIQRT